MKIRGLLWLVLGLFFSGVLCCSAKADGTVHGYVLVQMNSDDDMPGFESEFETQIQGHVQGTKLYVLRTPNYGDEDNFSTRVRRDSRVAFAEPDTFIKLGEIKGDPIHLPFDFSPFPQSYLRQQAYTQINFAMVPPPNSGLGVKVAVLDTGVNSGHPALRGHVLTGLNIINRSKQPTDLADGATNRAAGHGTMIAGLIAHLAPKAKILPVKVLDADGFGTARDATEGIYYAISQGAKIINMSFGSIVPSRAMTEALNLAQSKGIILIAAAGNDGSSLPHYPASLKNVISVGAVDNSFRKASFSNFGPNVTIMAPGSKICSSFYNGGYIHWNGTSFAAPFVTAEAALLLSAKPSSSAQMIIQRIHKTSRKIDKYNPGLSGQLGSGAIDIQAALRNF